MDLFIVILTFIGVLLASAAFVFGSPSFKLTNALCIISNGLLFISTFGKVFQFS